MSLNLPSHYVMQFASTLQVLLQQKGSKLRDRVTVGNYTGKQASPVDQVGAISMQPVVNRFAAMGRVDAPVDRRWVFPSDFDLPQLIDVMQPDGGVQAFAREHDHQGERKQADDLQIGRLDDDPWQLADLRSEVQRCRETEHVCHDQCASHPGSRMILEDHPAAFQGIEF